MRTKLITLSKKLKFLKVKRPVILISLLFISFNLTFEQNDPTDSLSSFKNIKEQLTKRQNKCISNKKELSPKTALFVTLNGCKTYNSISCSNTQAWAEPS